MHIFTSYHFDIIVTNDRLIDMKKIIFDGLIYSLQGQGGISRYFDELLNGLAEQTDYEVVLLLRKNTPLKHFHSKIKIETINSTIYTKNKILKYFSVFIDGLKTRNFLKNRSDLSNNILHHSYYRYFKNIPYTQVLTIHDFTNELFPTHFPYFLNKIAIYNKKKALLGADKIIAISHQTKADLLKLYDIAEDKTKVIHLGVNSIFKKEELEKENTAKPFFLFVGQRYSYKNFPFLLNTLSTWPKKNDYEMICLGGGEFTKTEKALLKKLNLENVVKQINIQDEKELVKYYNQAVALIYPSLYEGFGLPILEAMACATPVICSDIAVFHEVGGNLPLFFQNTTSDLIKCLELAKGSPSQKDESENKAIAWVNKFTWERTVAETLEFYEKLKVIIS